MTAAVSKRTEAWVRALSDDKLEELRNAIALESNRRNVRAASVPVQEKDRD